MSDSGLMAHLLGANKERLAAKDFKGLRVFAEITGKRFHRGVVLYTGSESVPFGEDLFALPANVLWHKRDGRVA